MGFLVEVSRSYSLAVMHGFLTEVTSFVEEHMLQGVWASVVVAHGFSCPRACGIFQDQGSNL